MLARLFFEVAICYLEREVRNSRSEILSQEQRDGLLSQLWQNPAFRNYIAEREGKIVYALAGGIGMEAEPRDKYHMKLGQRVEILLLASTAKKAYERTDRAREEKRKALEIAQKPSV